MSHFVQLQEELEGESEELTTATPLICRYFKTIIINFRLKPRKKRGFFNYDYPRFKTILGDAALAAIDIERIVARASVYIEYQYLNLLCSGLAFSLMQEP